MSNHYLRKGLKDKGGGLFNERHDKKKEVIYET